MGLAEDISDLLTTGGFSSTVHIGELRPRPNTASVIVQTQGLPTVRSFGGAVLEGRRIQMMCRSTSYPSADSLISSGYTILDGAKDKAVNGRLYHWIEALQPPFYLGEDEENRAVFAVNYSVMRSAST